MENTLSLQSKIVLPHCSGRGLDWTERIHAWQWTSCDRTPLSLNPCWLSRVVHHVHSHMSSIRSRRWCIWVMSLVKGSVVNHHFKFRTCDTTPSARLSEMENMVDLTSQINQGGRDPRPMYCRRSPLAPYTCPANCNYWWAASSKPTVRKGSADCQLRMLSKGHTLKLVAGRWSWIARMALPVDRSPQELLHEPKAE